MTDTVDIDEIEKKLSAARSTLIIDKPFLGAMVLRMPLIAADPKWCRTTGTDARAIYYNPDYIAMLNFDETLFILAHEALHCALSHFARRQHRVKHRWDLACDFAINPILIKDGLKPPSNALYLKAFEGMTAEEIYPMTDEFEDMQTHDDHLYEGDDKNEQPPPPDNKKDSQPDKSEGGQASQQEQDPDSGGAPRPQPLSSEEREQLAVQWQQRMAGAAQQAMQAGKLSGEMARLVDHLLQPQLPWRMLLAKYMTSTARDDYNYSRPSKREGEAILPSLRSQQVDIAVILDTSGSISRNEIEQFVSEVDAIKGQIRARIVLHACDNKLDDDGPWEYEYWEEFSLPENIKGGGGTSFKPAFEWLEREGRQPDLLVYFTDAEGEFPAQEPHYPVIWLVKGKSKIPWGQRVQLN